MADDTDIRERERADAPRVEPEPAGPTEATLARGRASGTPFVLLGGVALVIWAVVAVVAAALLLVWWLG
ncbi:MAG TPA: hypothetical protein VHH57_01620 [Gaiella sp.]|jgi:anti-sigma factor RsiW|nr:hypothetical protein [Gaiella sp.]